MLETVTRIKKKSFIFVTADGEQATAMGLNQDVYLT